MKTKNRGGLLDRLISAISAPGTDQAVVLQGAAFLRGKSVKVPFDQLPVQLILGPQDGRHRVLHLHLERPLASVPGGATPRRLVLIDPERYFSGISGQLTLEPGQEVALGKGDEESQALFHFPKTVSRRHVSLAVAADTVTVHDLHSESGTHVCQVEEHDRLVRWRRTKLPRIREIFGGPIRLLPPTEALATLKAFNGLLKKEAYRPANSRGKPGSVIQLPDDLTPILVGDLHARLDNLLKVLSEDSFLESLENGDGCLLILGDAVHPETEGDMQEMASSMLMMDLIFKLKIRFPDRVFYIRGNHDAFLPSVSKGGVAQGLIWERELLEVRGKAYLKAMNICYGRLPYVVLAKDFIACHAAPPTSKVTLEKLIEAKHVPGLVEELICNRVKRANYPSGYGKGDVRRLRKGLGLPEEFPFIVGHNPLADGNTVWLNAEGIDNHHVVFSAMTDQLSLFTRVRKRIVPICYPSEPLLECINSLPDESGATPGE